MPNEGTALVWVRSDGAQDCVAQDQLMTEVRARLGRDPFREPAQQRIEAAVTRERGLWLARIYEHDPDGRRIGSRVLSSSTMDCRELEAAAALAIALIIDPEASAGTPAAVASLPQDAGPPPPAGPQASPPPTPVASPPPAVRAPPQYPLTTAPPPPAAPPSTQGTSTSPLLVPSPRARPREDETTVLAGLALVHQLQPSLAPVLTLATERTVLTNVGVRLGVLFAPESRRTRSETDFAVGLTAFRAAGCYSSGQRIAPFGCAGMLAGAIHSVVYHPAPNKPGDRWWAAVSGEAGLHLRLGSLLLEIEGLLLVPLTRWRFEIGQDVVFTQASVLPGGALSAGTHFW